jgi:glycopeptide antibiotics resistance protein
VVGPSTLEHLAAMFIVGALFQSAWRFSLPTTTIILVAFTAGAEAIQLLTDTRHARVLDFGLDTTGALAGALIVSAFLKHSSSTPHRPFL